MKSVDRGDINEMSFGFETVVDTWERKEKEDIRTLEEVKVFDVSVVVFPAYKDTNVSVALRSLEEWQEKNKPEPSIETDEEEPEEKRNEIVPVSILRKQKELKDKTVNI